MAKKYAITKGDYDVMDTRWINEKSNALYFLASPKNATQKYLYITTLDGNGKLEMISPTEQEGTHDYSISADGKYGRHSFSNSFTRPLTEWLDMTTYKAITESKCIKARLREAQKDKTVEFFKVNTSEGIEMDGRISTRRLERYLALVAASGAEALVVLTKASLHPDPEARAEVIRQLAAPRRVLLLDLPAYQGGPQLRSALPPGTTAVLLGSSGAGKSTIVNYLADRPIARTGEIRASDARGKHTTTHRELFTLPSGVSLIDTPGMREIGLVGSEADIHAVFEDVVRLAERCRFRDCRHVGEPGCAVQAAAVSGELEEDRLDSFQRLQREAAREAVRRDEHARRQEGRAGSKLVREALRRKGR